MKHVTISCWLTNYDIGKIILLIIVSVFLINLDINREMQI